jgi:malate dehydrogenase (oxaloacetate-decarboxylating)
VATGRSDFPNQLNNALVFPGLFRGVLEVRARAISNTMAAAVARELAACAEARGLGEERILPRLDEWEIHARVAGAAALAAQAEGLARAPKGRDQVEREAANLMRQAREATRALMREGLIASP